MWTCKCKLMTQHAMPWELRWHVNNGIHSMAFEFESDARLAFRRSAWSSVLFNDQGAVSDQKTGVLDLHARGVSEILAERESRQGHGPTRLWSLGSSIRNALRWQTFPSEADARAHFQRKHWSMVLFDPSGVPVCCHSGFLDPRGTGVAALLQAQRASKVATVLSSATIHEAIESGDAPFIPREQGPFVRAALRYVWGSVASRSSVSSMWSRNSLCYLDVAQWPGVRGLVALTIDDAPGRLGPGNSMMRQVLDLLKAHDAHATFMIMGKFAEGGDGELVEALRSGHELGNHGLVDRKYSTDSESAFAEALEACSNAILRLQRAANVAEAVRWFRAPHGAYSHPMQEALRKRGLTNVMCDTYACCPVIQDGRFIGEFLASHVSHGSIALLHMPEHGFREWCLEGLAQLLVALDQRGFRAVTVGELVAAAGRDGDGASGLLPSIHPRSAL